MSVLHGSDHIKIHIFDGGLPILAGKPAILPKKNGWGKYPHQICQRWCKLYETRLRRDGWPVGGGVIFILHGHHLQFCAISLHVCAGVNLSFTCLFRLHSHSPGLTTLCPLDFSEKINCLGSHLFRHINTCYQRSIKSVFQATSTCYQHTIKSVFQVTSKCHQHTIKSVFQVTSKCHQRTIKSGFQVTSTCYQHTIKSVFQVTSKCHQRTIKSGFQVTSTCCQPSIKSVVQVTSTCCQRSIQGRGHKNVNITPTPPQPTPYIYTYIHTSYFNMLST